MGTAAAVPGDISLMFLAAKLAGELFERLEQPAVIDELLAGIVLGPYALGWIGVPTAQMVEAFHGRAEVAEALEATYEVLAELGVLVLLLLVGLEARLSDLGHLHADEARIILGAAVIDDILAMVILAVVSALGAGDRVLVGEVAAIAA